MKPNEQLTQEQIDQLATMISDHVDMTIMLSGDIKAIAEELRKAQNLIIDAMEEGKC